MFRALLVAAGLFVAVNAQANVSPFQVVVNKTNHMIKDVVSQGFNFVKGDSASYKLNMASFINGTMDMLVEDVGADGVWLDQNMDLGFMGKQQIRELIDPNTGEIKKLIVNGQEQQVPATGDVQVIDSKEENVTVPAGTFDCLYIKAQITQDGKTSNAEQWIDMKDVPVMGLVKTIEDSQLGPVTIELASFRHQQ